MHIVKNPSMEETIKKAMQYVRDKKVVPSMRSMQFAGRPIELNNSRIFIGKSYLTLDRKTYT
jgi:ribonucleoside-diphosphate reductase alpha chain